eukprot:560146-Pleurochrysis_carterae.AAC.1
MQLIQENNKEEMTIGVFSKCDLAYDPRFKQRKQSTPYWELEKRLTGDAHDMTSLPKSWIALKNKDSEIGCEESSGALRFIGEEREWFAHKANISMEVCETQCGIHALLNSIDELFTKHFQKTWIPVSILHVQNQMVSVQVKLQALGIAPKYLSFANIIDAFAVNFLHRWDELSNNIYKDVSHHLRLNGVQMFNYSDSLNNAREELRMARAVSGKPAIDAYLQSLKKAVQDSFAQCAAKHDVDIRLARFEILHKKVVQLMCRLVCRQLNSFRKELAKAIKELFRLQRIVSRHSIDVSKEMHTIVERELIIEALIIWKNETEEFTLRPFYNEDDDNGRPSPNSLKNHEDDSIENLLIESCADERAKLATHQYNLFLAQQQLKKLQGASFVDG